MMAFVLGLAVGIQQSVALTQKPSVVLSAESVCTQRDCLTYRTRHRHLGLRDQTKTRLDRPNSAHCLNCKGTVYCLKTLAGKLGTDINDLKGTQL